MQASAVIGMNYGDEGKGHITNFLCNNKTLNIRFNGGGQAAHAVFMDDGRNHIFHHFGSGTMSGARTMLTHHFIVNPIIFLQEFNELNKKFPMREVFIDPRCPVTTLYDMMINTFTSWVKKKTDTTGLGINETIERTQYRQLSINMNSVMTWSDDKIFKTLKQIRDEYVPYRIKKLRFDMDDFDLYFAERIKYPAKTIIEYIEAIKHMRKFAVVYPDDSLIDKFLTKEPGRNLIFEGAQGMLLDQRRKKDFPYLTRSNTDLTNVMSVLRTCRSQIELDVYLVTRAYLTRHGEGPMFHEVKDIADSWEEPTNPDNPFQGKMRYGVLNDLWRLWYKEALNKTWKHQGRDYFPKNIYSYNVAAAMTCLDQQDNIDLNKLPEVDIVSYGPMEKNISYKNDNTTHTHPKNDR